MKYTAKKLSTGEWAVFTGKKYFLSTVTRDEQAARTEALMRSGQWYHEQFEKCTSALLKLGAVSEMDPHAYVC